MNQMKPIDLNVKLKLSIKDNVFKQNGKKIVMKRKIIDYILMPEYIFILEEYTGDDYDIVYCYSTIL